MGEHITKDVGVTSTATGADAKKQNEKQAKHGMGTGKKILLGVIGTAMAVEGVGAVVSELTNDKPISGHTIVTDLEWPYDLSKSLVNDIKDAFTNPKNKDAYTIPDYRTIAEDSSIIINNLDLIRDLPHLPTSPTPKHDVYFLQPVENLDLSQPVQCVADIVGTAVAPSYKESIWQYAFENKIRNVVEEKNIPEDSVILAPFDGLVRLSSNPDNPAIFGASFYYDAPDGTQLQVSIGERISNGSGTFTSLISATPYTGADPENWNKYFVAVKMGQPVMTTNQLGNVATTANSLSKSSGELSPVNINFLSLPDPSTGEQKTVIVAK